MKDTIFCKLGDEHRIDVEHCDDFISIYSNAFPEGYCQHMVSEFERLAAQGAGGYRKNKKHMIDDYAIAILPGVHNLDSFKGINPVEAFFTGLQTVYDNYASKYSFLEDVNVQTTSMKMQRTDPGQGYHIYHAEAGPRHNYVLNPNRAIVYSLYLNTLDDDAGGETEFLYQKRRIKTNENTLILWPASYTHVHRGNLVLGTKSKYIITGWFFYGTN